MSINKLRARLAKSDFTAHQVYIATTYSIKNIIGKFYYKYIGMSFGNHAFVMFDFVTTAIKLYVNAMS